MNKGINVLLAGSIVLSLILLGVLFAGYHQPVPSAPIPVVTAKPSAPVKPVIDTDTWASLRAEDLPTMVARLRESGFPPEFLRAIISAQVREQYAERMKAVDPEAEQRPFWKNYSVDPKVRMAQFGLYREQQDILRTLLGADADAREDMNVLYRGIRFDAVPAEKQADVRRILREHDEARSEIFASSGGGMMGPEVQKRVEALAHEQHAALGSVLTPQELEEWDIRNSDTARSVRYQLSAFDASEAEFRTLFKLQSEFDERFPRTTVIPSPEEQQRRGEAQRQLNEQIKAALGPLRAADYERANDFNFRQTSQLVARLELPPATTHQIHDVQKEIQAKITGLPRANPAQPDHDQQLAKLAAEAESRVTAILGPRGFEAYRQYGGSWMQALRPRPPANPAGRAPAR